MSQGQHPTFLEDILASIAKFGPLPLLKIPREDALGSQWDVVTYSDFGLLLRRAASYWKSHLSESGLQAGDIIMLRVTGRNHTDLAHILGLCLAGYTPQLPSVQLPHSWKVVSDIMTRSKAKALLCDPLYASTYISPPVVFHQVPDFGDIPFSGDEQELRLDPLSMPGAATAFIFQTSGTTGTPKLIPISYDWVRNNVFRETPPGGPHSHQNLIVTKVGNWANWASNKQFFNAISCGDCVIKPTRPDFPPAELVAMARNAGLNKLVIWSTFLVQHLHAGQNDPEVLSVLQGLKRVVHSGVALQKEYKLWAYEHNIPLFNIHASTECGVLLTSSMDQGPDAYLQRPRGDITWVPFVGDVEVEAHGHQHPTAPLELVVPASHPACPHPSLRGGDPNANFHTGDLFKEVKPGLFEFIGRTDDLIKMRYSAFCNTSVIEANVFATCSGLLASCVAVGYGRASPALLVEAEDASLFVESRISTRPFREEIIRRIATFTQQLHPQERITNPALVRVVPPGSLPKTSKGNISRKAAEIKFSKEIEDMYAESVIE